MTKNLLLLEDDQSLIDGLVYVLMKEGYAVDVATTVAQAHALLAQKTYALLLLDMTLPDGNGLSVCESVRTAGSIVPIIFLTALDEEVQVIRALDGGGDDYITKPFKLGELCSRIRAQLRRSAMQEPRTAETLVSGDVRIDGARAYLGGQALDLTATELRLLVLAQQGAGADQADAAGAALGRSWQLCR